MVVVHCCDFLLFLVYVALVDIKILKHFEITKFQSRLN
jgi:hypothetical protein